MLPPPLRMDGDFVYVFSNKRILVFGAGTGKEFLPEVKIVLTVIKR
jgi:hypothetical protein